VGRGRFETLLIWGQNVQSTPQEEGKEEQPLFRIKDSKKAQIVGKSCLALLKKGGSWYHLKE